MKLKQKSLILQVFSKAALAALLLSGLQPVLVSANANVSAPEQVITTVKIGELTAPIKVVGKQILPDLQKSFNEAKSNNFVQVTSGYSFSQDLSFALESIAVSGVAAQKEVRVQKLATADLQISQNKSVFSIYNLQQETQSNQPVISANRVELPLATQVARIGLFSLMLAAIVLLTEQVKTKNSLQFEVLRC